MRDPDDTTPGTAETIASPAPGLDATTASSARLSGLEQTAASAGPAVRAAAASSPSLPIVEPHHYKRLEEFARGGLGRIVRARDERTGRIVALKEMLHLGNEDVAVRFAREARVTANLMHPAIVPVYEIGRWPSGEPFYAMKLVAGSSLKEVIDKTTSFSQRIAKLSHVIAVADALAYAHAQRVIHRDLKPGNVLVGDYGETVVIDWGLAKLIGEIDDVAAPTLVAEPGAEGDRTVVGSVLGTPFYMPPEQALGDAADERADVYAIGAILYHLVSGTPPFADHKPKDVAELLTLVSTASPTPLGTLEPATPPDLLTIVAKAMEKDADARYPSARELADDLRRFVDGRLVQAHRYTRRALVMRWLRRHRAAVIVASILVAMLIGGAIYSLDRIVDERDRSQLAERVAIEEASKARRGLALALLQKGRGAELDERWALATMFYAASRTYLDTPEARWSAALADARAITAHSRHVDHDSIVNAIAFSPDGERLISADLGGTVRVWSRRDGQTVAVRRIGSALWSLAVAPDGREVAVGSDAGVIHRLSLELEDRGELRGHTKRVWSLAYSPDGRALASAGEDATIRLWSSSGDSRLLRGHAQRVYSVAFSPDGKSLASASDDRDVRLWPVDGGESRIVGSHVGGGVRVVAFASDGNAVLSAGWDYNVMMWPIAGGAPTVWSDRHSVHAAAITPDGRAFVTAGDSGAIRIWEASTHTLVTTLDAAGGRVGSLAISRDGRWLASAGSKRVPVVYDLAALPRLVDNGGHRNRVWSITFTPDGAGFVTGSGDGTVRLWSARGDDLQRMRIGGATCHESLLPLGGVDDTIVMTCTDDRIRRWRAGVELPSFPTTRYLEFASVAADRRTLAGGHLDGIMQLVDLETGRVLVERKLHTHQIYVVQRGKSGNILTAGLDNTVKLSTPTLDPIRSFTARTTDGLLAAALSADERLVAAGGQDGTVDVWNASTGEVVAQLVAHDATIMEMTFSRDGSLLFTAGDGDHVLKAWSTATWSQAAELDAGEGGVMAIGASPDGKLLVTGHRSGGIVVWDIASRMARRRIGGRARDHGTCDMIGDQQWVDDAHRGIVERACHSDANDYARAVATRTRLRVDREVDVVEDWAP